MFLNKAFIVGGRNTGVIEGLRSLEILIDAYMSARDGKRTRWSINFNNL